MPLYNKLKEYRAKLGVNQQEMGALVQTSRQTISQIERGDAEGNLQDSTYTGVSSCYYRKTR